MAFAHLHVHSEYSLLDGACRLKDLVARAADMGFKAVAVTDHGAMYGVVNFFKEAVKAGIKPIIGCEVYVAPRSRFDMEYGTDSVRNPSRPAVQKRDGVQEPLPACQPRLYGRLLHQAAHRYGAAAQPLGGPHRPHGVPGR